MRKPPPLQPHAGLSTGVKLEKYARAILRQVQSLEGATSPLGTWGDPDYIGFEPMLLALAMEFGLKAWFVLDHNRRDPPKTHNLRRLFNELEVESRAHLERAFKERMGPFYYDMLCGALSVSGTLENHANAFVEWRYPHELRNGGLVFNTSRFVTVLEVVLDEFNKRYVTQAITAQRTV